MMWLPTSCTRTTSREGASRHRKNLIASQMKTNAGRRTPVEVECIHRFKDVAAEFIPRISLCEDAFPQGLGAIAAVRLLHDFKHQLIHTFPAFPGTRGR